MNTMNPYYCPPRPGSEAAAVAAELNRALEVLSNLLDTLKEGTEEYKAVEAEMISIGGDLQDLCHL